MEVRTIVVTLLCVWVAVYVAYYAKPLLRPPDDLEIVQTAVQNLTPALLRERVPVVVADAVVDARDLGRKVLRFQHAFSREHTYDLRDPSVRIVKRTSALSTFFSPKFVVEENDDPNRRVTLALVTPGLGRRARTTVAVPLRPHQVLALPAHWHVRCGGDGCALRCVEFFDLPHLLMAPLGLLANPVGAPAASVAAPSSVA